MKNLFRSESSRRTALAAGQVVPEAGRCVQCGICNFNCPIGLDVRRHAWNGQAVVDSYCLNCGECITRCPRAVLRFDSGPMFRGER